MCILCRAFDLFELIARHKNFWDSVTIFLCWTCSICRNRKSESCPFCRGSLRRVNSEDLWVLTCDEDVVDAETVSKEDLLRFYLYINKLPKDNPDALFLMYYEYLIWFSFEWVEIKHGTLKFTTLTHTAHQPLVRSQWFIRYYFAK